ncbi:MAG: sulfatase-like hydrolase/transferase [Bacteroidota bacterium]
MSHLFLVVCLLSLFSCRQTHSSSEDLPNILFVIADDWSYPHASFLGDPVVQTPNFDRISREGIVFDQAYVSSPSCTPSRAAMLTGQYFWRLQEGANLYGPLRPEHTVYPDLLEKAGYHVGYTEKGWGPGEHEGRPRNPAGDFYDSFDAFMAQRPAGEPFCFWFGSHNPHRGYKKGSGQEAGIDLDAIQIPPYFPDDQTVRSDIADYYKEVQDYDAQIGELMEHLEASGEIDNTLIVITSDNGMPFPHCKGNLYDLGTRVPLAIRWGNVIHSHRRFEDFVSLTDLAPTFLEVAGLPIPTDMTGKSLLPYLVKDGQITDQDRNQVFTGRERHVPGQESGDWGGYPMRAVRTHDFLYIRNFRSDRWPAGSPNYQKATLYPSYYSGVDPGPTRTVMLDNQETDADHANRFSLSFGKRPEVELYDLRIDPNQMKNVANDPTYSDQLLKLDRQLMEELTQTEDARVLGQEVVFESYPYTGGTISPPHFQRKSRHYATEKVDNFPSQHISSRTIEVLIPTNVQHDARFPVLYMFDGQNIFHSFKGWGGEMNKGWRVPKVLDSLSSQSSIPQMIVVGIYNSPKRMSEYMPAKPKQLLSDRIASTDHKRYMAFKTDPPQSDEQLRFIVEELKPYIDTHYKTLPDQANTFIAGSSMGGLISAYAICEYPEVFGGAACFSTHWLPLDGVFLEYFNTHLPDPATHKLYFDFGTEGLDREYEPFQTIADAALEARGYQTNKNWITRTYPGAKHHEDDWHARLHVPIEFFFSDN